MRYERSSSQDGAEQNLKKQGDLAHGVISPITGISPNTVCTAGIGIEKKAENQIWD